MQVSRRTTDGPGLSPRGSWAERPAEPQKVTLRTPAGMPVGIEAWRAKLCPTWDRRGDQG